MSWAILIAATLVAALITGLVAWYIARRLAQTGGEVGVGLILLVIVISLVVLQGAAKLALIVAWLFERQGIDPDTALDGQIGVVLFAASFVPIGSYVVTFLLTFRKVKAAT